MNVDVGNKFDLYHLGKGKTSFWTPDDYNRLCNLLQKICNESLSAFLMITTGEHSL